MEQQRTSLVAEQVFGPLPLQRKEQQGSTSVAEQIFGRLSLQTTWLEECMRFRLLVSGTHLTISSQRQTQ